MTLTTITITRIIGANLEVVDPIEDKIQDVSLEAKISVEEIRTHTKANIKMMAIKAKSVCMFFFTAQQQCFCLCHIRIKV